MFFAEAVTLAHVARPFVLANALDPNEYEVVLAADPRYQALFPDTGIARRAIRSISSDRFLGALAVGKPLYDRATLTRYVEEDLSLIEAVSPDLVVGDLRLSLGMSGEIAGVPYVNITNAYWSPYAALRYRVPELPLTRLLGAGLGQILFDMARPLAFALHAAPMNRTRKHFGLRPLKRDLRHVYTDGDYVLYADIPDLFEIACLPANHRFLGPVLWSPAVDLPDWWGRLPDKGRPIIYLTLGSSGAVHALATILEACNGLDAAVMVATAGRVPIADSADHVYVADYLPGALAVDAADLVICNGGSPTTYQALAAGKPVLGVPSNMDQYLNMRGITRAGAGEYLRSESLSATALAAVVRRMLQDSAYGKAARALAQAMSAWDARLQFGRFLTDIVNR